MLKLICVCLLAATVAHVSGSYESDDSELSKEKGLLQLFSRSSQSVYDIKSTSNRRPYYEENQYDYGQQINENNKDRYHLHNINRMKVDSKTVKKLQSKLYGKCLVDPSEISFILFNDKDKYALLNLANLDSTAFNPAWKTKIYIPGSDENVWQSAELLAKAYFAEKREVNLIVVNWSEYSQCLLGLQLTETFPDVGRIVAFLINVLLNKGVNMEDVHVITHNVGVHIVKEVLYRVNETFPRITVLDPYSPSEQNIPITRNDGKKTVAFIDVIYTNLDSYCHVQGIPHALFFPNGGVDLRYNQRNGLSLAYYAMSINNPQLYVATQCGRYLSYVSGICKDNEQNYMGEYVSTKKTGTYFLTASSPVKTEELKKLSA